MVACGGDKDNTDNKAEDTSTPATSTDENVVIETDKDKTSNEITSSEDISMNGESKLSVVEVVNRAKEDYKDYKLESISYDKDDGEYYNVELFMDNNEVSLYINPLTGEIIKKEEEIDGDTKTGLDEKYLDNVEEYLDQALEDADVYGKVHYIDEWKLGMEDGRPLLEAEIFEKESRKEAYTYKIDPENGKVLEKETDE